MDRRRRHVIQREEAQKRAAELLAKQVDTVYALDALALYKAK
jgi:hypothetical protein